MLLGRDADLEALGSALADVAHPVALYGEAGVGKTSLIHAAVQASGRLMYEAGCLATLSWMPYLPLHRAFGATADVATGSRPGRWGALADLNAGDPAFVAAEVETAVGHGVLVLDDVQWADAATRRVIPLLVGRVRMIAAIRRADPAAGAALDLLRDAGFVVHELDPLPDPYAGALARRVRPELSAGDVADIVARSGGNPLLIEELAGTGVAGASLRLALTARLRQLPRDCRDAVGLLALAEQPLPVAALGDAADRIMETGLVRVVEHRADAPTPEDGPAAAPDDAGDPASPDDAGDPASPGAAVTAARSACLRHGLLAEVIAEMLEPAQRVALHERLAELAADPGAAARHLLAAGHRRRAHDAAMRAADTAASPGERAQHIGLAASCLDGPDAAELRLAAAEQLAQVGQFAAAEPLLADLGTAGAVDRVARARAAAIRVRIAYEAMDREACRRHLREGLEAAADSDHPIAVHLACEEAFVALMVDYEVDRALELAQRATDLAESRGVSRGRAHYVLGTVGYIAGKDIWDENLATAVELARAEGELTVECSAANNLITAHESSGIPERGRELADAMIDRAQQLHLTEWRHQYEAMRLNLACHAGDYAAVLSDAARLLAEPLRLMTRRQVQMTSCLALVDTGRIGDAYAMIETIVSEESGPDTHQESVHFHRAEALLWDGKPARALAEWPAHREHTADSMDMIAFSSATFAWAALWCGEPIPDFGELTLHTRMCRAAPFEVAAIRALREERFADAVADFDRAAEVWQPYNARNTVRSRWGAGEALRRAGRTDEAVTRLLAAEQEASEHEMVPLLGQIRSSLRAAGVSRSAPRVAGHRSEAGPGGATGPDSLSGREREVLTLVGQGLSDSAIGARLGISPRTVESQLASARRKLGARTRHQAAAMLVGV